MGKTFSLKRKLPFSSKTATLVTGCFDLIHAGHIEFLKRCKKVADKLVVGVHSDEITSRKSPGRPIIGENDRAFIISELECVDWVYINKFLYSDRNGYVIRRIKPKSIIFSTGEKSASTKSKELSFKELSFIEKNFPQIEIKFVPRQRLDVSTTQIIDTILKKDISLPSGNTSEIFFLNSTNKIYSYLRKLSKRSNAEVKTSSIIVSSENNQLISYGVNYHPTFKGKIIHKNKDTLEYSQRLPRPTHAEIDAVLNLRGIQKLAYGYYKMYTLKMPCAGCAEFLKRIGIKEIYYFEDFDNNYGEAVLRNSSVKLVKINMSK